MDLLDPDITIAREPQAMSEEEFLRLDGWWAEWVEGVTHFMSPVSVDHDQIMGWISSVLRLLAEEKKLGVTYAEPFVVKLPKQKRMRSPDVMFVAAANPGKLEPVRFVGAPDLIVEIVSPDSIRRDKITKRAEYGRAGVREYLILDPLEKTAALLRLDDEGKYSEVAPVSGRLRSAVVEGFFFEPKWLRSLPLPSVYRIVREMGL